MLSLQLLLFFLLIMYVLSCAEKPVEKKSEMWAAVIDFLSPDSSYYSSMKNFPFPDTLQFSLPDTLFVNQNRLPIISDSSIIYYKRYEVNGKIECCQPDTLEIYTDTIKGKKYIFVIGDYIALFQSDSLSKLRPRKKIETIPLWGIDLNTPYPPDSFLNKYEKLGANHVKLREELDEVSRQTWANNDSIYVETIQFDDMNDRVITSIYKDINEVEADSLVNYFSNTFPFAKHKETVQKDVEGKRTNVKQFFIDGYSITITQTGDKKYSFQATDYYETLRLILNKQQHYTFRDDVKVY